MWLSWYSVVVWGIHKGHAFLESKTMQNIPNKKSKIQNFLIVDMAPHVENSTADLMRLLNVKIQVH